MKVIAYLRGVVVFEFVVPPERVDSTCEMLMASGEVDAVQYTIEKVLDTVKHKNFLGMACEHDIVRTDTRTFFKENGTWIWRSSLALEKVAGVYYTDEEVIAKGRKAILGDDHCEESRRSKHEN